MTAIVTSPIGSTVFQTTGEECISMSIYPAETCLLFYYSFNILVNAEFLWRYTRRIGPIYPILNPIHSRVIVRTKQTDSRMDGHRYNYLESPETYDTQRYVGSLLPSFVANDIHILLRRECIK